MGYSRLYSTFAILINNNEKVEKLISSNLMARLNFAFFCEHTVMSREGTPSFIGVFSEIIGKSLPILRGEMIVVVSVYPDDTEKHELKIIIQSPDGQEIKSFVNNIGPATSKENDIGFILNIPSFRFEKEGLYNFGILVDNQKVGVAPLMVKK